MKYLNILVVLFVSACSTSNTAIVDKTKYQIEASINEKYDNTEILVKMHSVDDQDIKIGLPIDKGESLSINIGSESQPLVASHSRAGGDTLNVVYRVNLKNTHLNLLSSRKFVLQYSDANGENHELGSILLPEGLQFNDPIVSTSVAVNETVKLSWQSATNAELFNSWYSFECWSATNGGTGITGGENVTLSTPNEYTFSPTSLQSNAEVNNKALCNIYFNIASWNEVDVNTGSIFNSVHLTATQSSQRTIIYKP